MIVPPSEVFSKVDSVRELDTVNIALTDYGFWDIEVNRTNNVTYSYRNGKSYDKNVGEFNNDNKKLIDPTIFFAQTTKYCEYSSDEYGIDRLWTHGGDWYKCDGIQVDGKSKQYRDAIIINGKSLPFYGATENFALYGSSGNEPIHLLVSLTL